jgi:hypothetical protein
MCSVGPMYMFVCNIVSLCIIKTPPKSIPIYFQWIIKKSRVLNKLLSRLICEPVCDNQLIAFLINSHEVLIVTVTFNQMAHKSIRKGECDTRSLKGWEPLF